MRETYRKMMGELLRHREGWGSNELEFPSELVYVIRK
jgi:hypothetical protein